MVIDYVMAPCLVDGGLVSALIELELLPKQISAVQLAIRTPSPTVRTLVAVLRRRLAMTL